MKRFRRLLAVVLIEMILCGCIEQAPPDFSSGTVSAAPVSSSAPEPDNPVSCPDHDPNLAVTNQNAQESALLIAPDGEEGLWIWTPSKADASLGTLVQTPAAPAVVRWPEEITAGGETPLWPGQTALYQNGSRITLCCAALENERQVVLFDSTDGGTSWSAQRFELPFSAAGAGCFLSSFGEGGMSAFVSSATPGSGICGFVRSDTGSGWSALASAASVVESEQGAPFTWAGMVSDRIGFVCCGYKANPEPDVWATNDGGESWFALTLPLPEGFDTTQGYLVGSAAALDGDVLLLYARWVTQGTARTVTYRSEDWGVSWQLTEVGDPLS